MTSKKYVKLSQVDHVLKRPSVYIGSIVDKKEIEYTFDFVDNEIKVEKKEIKYSQAIIRVFIEALSNAIDNLIRSRKSGTPCKYIKVNYDKTTKRMSVVNDGEIIPIEINEEEKMYNHTLIFGNLLTSSNYDDTEQRDWSGLNGMGIKLLNIFSTFFSVSGIDPANKKTFYQEWHNNMKEVKDPIVGKSTVKSGYTKVEWVLDFKRFGIEEYTEDILSLFRRYIVETSMLSGVNVYYNDYLIPIKSLIDYSRLILNIAEDADLLQISTPNTDIVITTSKTRQFEQISFINGIHTKNGGTHVAAICEALFRPIIKKLSNDKTSYTLTDIKKYFTIVAVATCKNPVFDSQQKHMLESPFEVDIKKNVLTKLLKWPVIDEIKASKEMVILKKLDSKKKGFVKIEGLDQANLAGSSKSTECTLILVEGLSAKTFAVKGIEVGAFGTKGRDFYGIYALSGKCSLKGTKIMMWDGSIKKVEDVKIGDLLINENGEPTKVLELFNGEDDMYEVKQEYGKNYTVNSEHTLTLKYPSNGNIVWNEDKKRWKMYYYDRESHTITRKYINCIKSEDDKPIIQTKEYECVVGECNWKFSNRSNLVRHHKKFHPDIDIPKPEPYTAHNRSFLSKEDGYNKMVEFSKTVNTNKLIDVNIQDCLKFNNETKRCLKGVKLDTAIKWEKKNVELDPYILGMWLGDGNKSGYGFSSEDIELINYWYEWCLNNDCEIVHNSRDSFNIRSKNSIKRGGVDKRIAIGNIDSSSEECRACNYKFTEACCNDSELKQLDKERIIQIHTYDSLQSNNFAGKLKKYNLLNNKHIPMDYIINDKETRLKLLAGFIDTDGYVQKSGMVEITQSDEHKNLIDELDLLCKSLGLYTSIKEKMAVYYYKDEKKYKKCYRLLISGNNLKEVPTILPRKKITHTFTQDCMTTPISVEKKGRGEYYGFMTDKTHRFLLEDFTITHNCLNVRNAKPSSIADNKVVSNIVKSLGLIYNRDYTDDGNYKTLKYGRVLIISDQDCDGIHINALIQNVFHYLYPSLLKRQTPFITSLQTPIVRVFLSKPRKSLIFYDERKYQEYVRKQPANSKINKMYYKGLGTSTDDDIKETFGRKIIQFKEDEKTTPTMIKAFHKDETDTRKTWLTNYDPNKIVINWGNNNDQELLDMSLTDFIDTELIKFSLADCQRSIPHLMDGLKESQRKVLYACILKNLKYSGKTLKVAQLAGFVAEKTGYHHGEGNLYDTITKMAHRFVGSNNIPLLYAGGQFGSRLEGGGDAANARYIFTKMDRLTRMIFNADDDILLESREDDGEIIEPKFYMPILPMVLVNGASSIGTGWSCSIPCYNPIELVGAIKTWLENGNSFINTEGESVFPDIKPWYNGYSGTIEKDKKKEGKYISYGDVKKDGKKFVVDELPIGYWTNKFKDYLDDLLEEKKIKSVKNYSTPEKVNFVLVETPEGVECNVDDLKLYKYINTSNMVLYDVNGKIKKYNTIEEIVNEFCGVRLQYYIRRKKYKLDVLEKEIRFLGNKRRFLQDVLEGEIKLFDELDGKKKARNVADLYRELELKKYDKWNSEEEDEEGDVKRDKGYDYLLKLQFRSITQENIDKLKNDIDSRIASMSKLQETSEKQIWINDLEEFEKEHNKKVK